MHDTGIDAGHADLTGATRNELARTLAGTGAPGAPTGSVPWHGTAVAGVIAARRNGIGGVGVAPEAELISLADPMGQTFPGAYLQSLGVSRQYADIQNNSWGFTLGTSHAYAFGDDLDRLLYQQLRTALRAAVGDGRDGLGTLIVHSAGNGRAAGDDGNLWATHSNRYAAHVGATDAYGRTASYSTPSAALWVAAPGGSAELGVLSTDISGTAGASAGDYVSGVAGTSFAAPAVSGTIALMLEANPLLGWRDLRTILAAAARPDPNAAGAAANSAGTWNGGGLVHTRDQGFGLIDARAAVRLAEHWDMFGTGPATLANERAVQSARTGSLAIPDAGQGAAIITLSLAAGVRIDAIEIDIALSHNRVGDLVITLASPFGTTSTLLSRAGTSAAQPAGLGMYDIDWTFTASAFLGESSGGNWTLRVEDRAAGQTGSVLGAVLRAFGSPDTPDDRHILTDSFATLAARDAARRTIIDTNGGIDTLDGSALSGALSVDLGAGSATIAGVAATLTAGAFEHAIGGDGTDTIAGTPGANWLRGGRGNDTLRGGAGDDRLEGEAGDDRLDGGAGLDTAVIRAGFGDTAIQRRGAETVLVGPDGTDTLAGIERVVFLDRTIGLGAVSRDIVADGRGDLLMREAATGRIAPWQAQGATLVAAAVIGGTPSGCTLAGIGDVDGDGDADIVWHNEADGWIRVWRMDGAAARADGVIATAGAGFAIAAIADTDGDGTADLIWRDPDNGALIQWRMENGRPMAEAGLLGAPPQPDAVLAAAADLDADGDADLIWHDRAGSGAVTLWGMEGGAVAGTRILGGAGGGWRILAAADADGDGDADIFWHNEDDGRFGLWRIEDGAATDYRLLGIAPTNWTPTDFVDLTGDGRAEIVWRNHHDGRMGLWQMGDMAAAPMGEAFMPNAGWSAPVLALGG
ncbi:MAG: S8 family serine peptidase [Alphaproteobacteria bacterium]|nr:S8 family serine peptidase [Alphaproteobacteria bacterium]